MLQSSAPTRWGLIRACLDSILKAEAVLHSIVSDRNLIHGTSKQRAGQMKVRDTVMSQSFIFNLNKCLSILEPIDSLIVKFRSDKASLSDVCKSFNVLGPTLAALEGLSSQEQTYLNMMAKYRFHFTYGDAHGIAYMLDPVYIGDGLPLPLRESIENTIFKHYFDDQPPSSEKQSQIYQEYNAFRSCALH
jgi:hypothetical protein